MLLIGVLYNDEDSATYEGIEVDFADHPVKAKFNTGNVVRDIRAALRFALAFEPMEILFRSSFDHYLMDSGLHWDSLGIG